MVECGPDQGRNEAETTDVAGLRRGFQLQLLRYEYRLINVAGKMLGP